MFEEQVFIDQANSALHLSLSQLYARGLIEVKFDLERM